MFDADGYYRTGDIVAELGPDQLKYLDRRNNVLKLSQGEFVTVSKLEAVFGDSPLVRQIFVYGNSARSYLLAVVVPTDDALARHDADALKPLITESLQDVAQGGGPAVLRDPARLHHRDNAFHARERSADRHPQARAAEAQGVLRRSARTAVHRPGRRPGQRAAGAAPHGADRPVLETISRAAGALLGAAASRPAARCALHRSGWRFVVGVDIRQSAARDLRHRRARRRHRQPGQRPGMPWPPTSRPSGSPAPRGRRSRRCTAATRPRCTPAI